jgi:hypothetical protein
MKLVGEWLLLVMLALPSYTEIKHGVEPVIKSVDYKDDKIDMRLIYEDGKLNAVRIFGTRGSLEYAMKVAESM